MKKCPTCDKTFEDSMKFCQVDGTPLVDDAPAFDPYATIVGHKKEIAPSDEAPSEPAFEPQPEEPAAIAPPENVLELPEADPLKTMYVSEAELKEVLQTGEPPADAPPAPERPSFIAHEVPPPSFGDVAPPPSPFSTPEPAAQEPTPAPPPFDERETMIQQPASFETPSATPVAEWTPPPAPEAAWENQPVGSNTPFQPPAAGVAGQNKTLAIISMISGIVSLLCCSWFIVGLAAIIMGFIARNKAKTDPAQFGGEGMALAGMITGGISVLLGVLFWILYVFGFMANILGNAGRF